MHLLISSHQQIETKKSVSDYSESHQNKMNDGQIFHSFEFYYSNNVSNIVSTVSLSISMS